MFVHACRRRIGERVHEMSECACSLIARTSCFVMYGFLLYALTFLVSLGGWGRVSCVLVGGMSVCVFVCCPDLFGFYRWE
jgi:hypothetical protein